MSGTSYGRAKGKLFYHYYLIFIFTFLQAVSGRVQARFSLSKIYPYPKDGLNLHERQPCQNHQKDEVPIRLDLQLHAADVHSAKRIQAGHQLLDEGRQREDHVHLQADRRTARTRHHHHRQHGRLILLITKRTSAIHRESNADSGHQVGHAHLCPHHTSSSIEAVPLSGGTGPPIDRAIR